MTKSTDLNAIEARLVLQHIEANYPFVMDSSIQATLSVQVREAARNVSRKQAGTSTKLPKVVQ